MVRTQIQLPEALHARLKAIAAAEDRSLAEVIRRASELYVKQRPGRAAGSWELPTVDCGALLVPLERLRDFSEEGAPRE